MRVPRSRLKRPLIRWTSWHDRRPLRAGGFVLIMSLGLSAAAYVLGALAQRNDDEEGSEEAQRRMD